MPRNAVAPIVLSALLCSSLVPVGAHAAALDAAQPADAGTGDALPTSPDPDAAQPADAGEATLAEGAADEPSSPADRAPEASSAASPEPASAGAGASIVRDGERIAFPDLPSALDAARDGETVEVLGDHVLDRQLAVSDGRSVTLRATGAASLARGPGFPRSGGKVAGMVRLSGSSSLALESADPAAYELVLDGAGADSDEAVVTLLEGSSLAMGAGTAVEDALCSWKPWASVYVRSGSFTLDGGEIRGALAMRNPAVAVEAGGSFDMRAGSITDNKATYSESIVWTKGSFSMSGGAIAGNVSNVSADGVVHVLSGGSFALSGGVVGDNRPNNTFGVRVDAGASLEIGSRARLEGADRVSLARGGSLSFSGAPEAHSVDDPVEVVLAGTWDDGDPVAGSASPEVARAVLSRLSVRRAGTPERAASVGIDPADASRIALAPSEVTAAFDLLENPFADDLALEMRPELTAPGAFDALREQIEAHFSGIDTPERRLRLQQLDRAWRYASYLQGNRDALAASVRELSQLGDPGAEARRTQQGYQFDNLDATGLYLKPGRVNEIAVYVEAEDPSKLSVAWRQVGLTDTSNYPSLNLAQTSKLVNGENRITVDLTGKTYGSMLYMRNDSADNAARVRIEAVDAVDTEPVTGTSLGTHPYYEHDPAHPERFWAYVQDIRAYAARVRAGEAADMTMLQMGDDGHAQFAISATAVERAYAGIASEEDAVAYIERSNRAIQDRLEFYWSFDGFDAAEAGGPNAVTTARVHTAFTRTVSNPSTMYAYGRYFHMPESTAAAFLSGASMYGWGMSHEYGHMLDNNVIAVAEETNNLYSIAGARHGGIEAARSAGIAFNPSAYYHVNAVNATRRRDEELARMAADSGYVPDWMNGDVWGTYIWTHVTTWWNGLHFFDDWDYSGYDFSASPYTEQIAADVERYGAYGATLRILRGDPDAVKTIEDLASNAATGVKYNRMAVAFTMGTGYDFAEYLYGLGERDLAPEVREWCARYPSMPRKVRYFSLDTDAAIINGAKTYAEVAGAPDEVEPEVSVSVGADGGVRVQAGMPTDELRRATCAYELYRDGELVGFSRTGSFSLEGDGAQGGVPASAYTVVAYDVRLNPSGPGAAQDIPLSATVPSLVMGEGPGALELDGPQGAAYRFEAADPGVVSVDADGTVTALHAGSTDILVTMTLDGVDYGPYRFTVTVAPRPVTVRVGDAETFAGCGLPAVRPTVEGGLLPGDELGDVAVRALAEDGADADLSVAGTYRLVAETVDLGPDYDVTLEPGVLTVRQDALDPERVARRDEAGGEVAGDAWSDGAVELSLEGAAGDAGTYDLIAVGDGDFAERARIDTEGEVEHEVRGRIGAGGNAGATTSAARVTTRIDRTDPTVRAQASREDVAPGDDVTIEVEAADDPAEGVAVASGVDRIEARIYDAAGALLDERIAREEELVFELGAERAGAYRVEATSYDRAGNASDTDVLEIRVAGDDETGDGSGEQPGGGSDTGSGEQPGGGDDTGSGEQPGGGSGAETPDGGSGGSAGGDAAADADRTGSTAGEPESTGILARTGDASQLPVLATAAGAVAALGAGLLARLRSKR